MSFHFNITCVVLFVLCLIPKNPTLFLYKLMIETYLIMLEIGKRAEMIAYDYRHYLALAHCGFPVSVALSLSDSCFFMRFFLPRHKNSCKTRQ